MNQVAAYFGNAVLATLAAGYLYGFSLQVWVALSGLAEWAYLWLRGRPADSLTRPRWYDFAAAGVIFAGIVTCFALSLTSQG